MPDFKANFCPSPWFHMRITNLGNFAYCRWPTIGILEPKRNIKTDSIVTFFQQGMAEIRKDMVSGITPSGCSACIDMDEHNKVSGRQRQLLKAGIKDEYYEKSLISSPWYSHFEKALEDGTVDLYPQDWQIDLGNFCNSTCVMCEPSSSSKIAAEFRKLKIIETVPAANWSEDPEQLNRLVEVLTASKKIAYIHFIGGETLITPAFRVILTKLIEAGINKQITLGFTTNMTVWDDGIIDLLVQFKEINLGLSIECVHPVNDYIRLPSKIESVKVVMDKWITLANKLNWLIQIRTTPTVLSLLHLDTVFEYAYNHKIAVESCNFIDNPIFLRATVLPMEYRLPILEKLKAWVASKQDYEAYDAVVNIRSPAVAMQQVVEDAKSYISYLENQPDESFRLPELISYLKKLESNRHNSVLDYLPEYEQLFKDAGY